MTKLVNKKNTSHLSQMVIGQGHTIMLGDIPDNVNNNDENLLRLNENLFSWREASKESVQSFGLFGSDIILIIRILMRKILLHKIRNLSPLCSDYCLQQ